MKTIRKELTTTKNSIFSSRSDDEKELSNYKKLQLTPKFYLFGF